MAIQQALLIDYPGALGREVSTELATSLFGIVAGAFGGVAGLIASRRLEGIPGSIQLGTLAVPVAVAGLSTVAGAFLIPSDI